MLDIERSDEAQREGGALNRAQPVLPILFRSELGECAET